MAGHTGGQEMRVPLAPGLLSLGFTLGWCSGDFEGSAPGEASSVEQKAGGREKGECRRAGG